MDVYDYMHLKAWDEINTIDTAVRKAKKQGIEQGVEQGIEQEKIETAKNAIKQGLDNQMISAITELSPDEVEKLR